jgi:uncharacterized protein YjiK
MVLKKISLFFLVSILFVFSQCRDAQPKKEENKNKDKQTGNKNAFTSPPGYDLNKPVILNLRTELDEISGLAFYPKDTSVFGITDEHGWLYKIHLTGNFKIEKWKFSKGQDYEDLVLLDSTFYILASNGELAAFKFIPNKPLIPRMYSLSIEGKNEFETLYHDNASGKLVMICKDCEGDNKKTVTAYSFDPATQTFSDTPFFILNADEIAEQLGEHKIKFKPSAACINPLTNELYIISSVNKALVIADTKGNVKSVYSLNPQIYKQPEGITFTPSGSLIISNEVADVGAANLLIFKYKSTVK